MAMNEQEFSSAFPLFGRDTRTMIRDLYSAGRQLTVPAGTEIYREGEACTGIAFVLSGDIRVYKIGQTGREITLYEIGRGETCILNASCILAGKGYPANAAALTDVSALIVPADVFRRLVRDHEEMRDYVFSLLSQRLAGVMELVEEVAFGKMDARLDEYLTTKAENGRINATHQTIANDLGTSREVVSRLLKHFEQKGRVRLSRNTIIMIDQLNQ